jgi:hypothetical protein
MRSLPGKHGEAMEGDEAALPSAAQTSTVQSILNGFRYAWSNSLLRTILAAVAAINLLVTGPLLVGIPVLAANRLPEGAAALGTIMSAFAGGNLAGYALIGFLSKPKRPGLLVPPILGSFGLILGVVGLLDSTLAISLMLFSLGVGTGYLSIALVTWLQKRAPEEMMGRMMSLVLFANMGLVPFSQALAGTAIGWSLSGLLICAGALVVAVALLLSLSNELREARL